MRELVDGFATDKVYTFCFWGISQAQFAIGAVICQSPDGTNLFYSLSEFIPSKLQLQVKLVAFLKPELQERTIRDQ
eukprot:3696645-Amphidinium_carterae.1